MAQRIQNYRQPGAYSTITPQPVLTTAEGNPVVAVVGQALQGPYTPQLFTNPADSTNFYGTASINNPLALGIKIAFANGAPQVLGINVEPDNSLPPVMSVNINSLPVSAYSPAPQSALDAVTQQPVNVDGITAGTFYIQNFNPVVKDPLLNNLGSTAQQVFSNAGSSIISYLQLLGATFVPDAISQQQQITIQAVKTSTPPTSAVSQAQWNQFQNALALMNGFATSYNSPVNASILIPDSGQSGNNPIPGYREFYSAYGQTVNVGTQNQLTFTNMLDLYTYAATSNSVLYIYGTQQGSENQIVYGLFDSNTANDSSTNGVAFGLPNLGISGNPFGQFNYGSDGVVTLNSYINVINNILGNQRADLIVVLNTDPSIQSVLEQHVTLYSSTPYKMERVALVSGPTSEIPTTTITNVTALQGSAGAKRMMYVYPTIGYYNDIIRKTIVGLDGTFIACALAGIMASHDAAEPLTHKVLTGFVDIGKALTVNAANTLASYGVCIIENDPQYGIRVRHQLTCDPTSPDTQEISVVRQLDYTAQVLRDYMNNNFVGTKINKSTLGKVVAAATSILQSLVDGNIIFGFLPPTARINPNNPTDIQLACGVQADYPCNYVDIDISITSVFS